MVANFEVTKSVCAESGLIFMLRATPMGVVKNRVLNTILQP